MFGWAAPPTILLLFWMYKGLARERGLLTQMIGVVDNLCPREVLPKVRILRGHPLAALTP